jgi:hypothetical protein
LDFAIGFRNDVGPGPNPIGGFEHHRRQQRFSRFT